MFKKQRSSVQRALRRIDRGASCTASGAGASAALPMRKAEGAVLTTQRSAYTLQVQIAESLLTRGI
jgi:hypothetical protein